MACAGCQRRKAAAKRIVRVVVSRAQEARQAILKRVAAKTGRGSVNGH
jgi:hypothetical protein